MTTMLLSMRRYRAFLAVAALLAFSVYYLSGGRRPQFPENIGIVHNPLHGPGDDTTDAPNDGSAPSYQPAVFPDHLKPAQPPLAAGDRIVNPDVDAAVPKRPNLASSADRESSTHDADGSVHTGDEQSYDDRTPSRVDDGRERFPIADKDVIKLPQDEPKALPKIQFAFEKESAAEQEDRVQKQTIIRKSFAHAWSGYKRHAMGHDELKPLSKSGVNQTQFMGWGATLVDSLDTLWIMGLTDEFNEAVKQVAQISFKTSSSKTIPLFETVIRYLGGLIAAHDLSSGKQPILLNKAIELADVLMGAFDTPNRMPIPHFHWRGIPTAEIPLSHRNTVLAELGSLSLEFTRLAQITKNDRYYDAVARITNALEKYQPHTKVPGLWPLRIDSSGCKDISKPRQPVQEIEGRPQTRPDKLEEPIKEPIKDPYDHDDLHNAPVTKHEPPQQVKDPYDHPELDHEHDPASAPSEQRERDMVHDHRKRDFAQPTSSESSASQYSVPGCEPQGLRHEPNAKLSFGIGGLADSVYEYMPKMYALLGGQNKQYRLMYEYAIKTVKDHLLFRPMIEDEKRNILFASRLEYDLDEKDPEKQKTTIWEATHLACFAGGMVGLASRVFDEPKDLDLAKKLTDGCIWAYESTPSGVMAESFNMAPCDSQNSCPWDEKRWHQILDFGRQGRLDAVALWDKKQEEFSVGLEDDVSDGEPSDRTATKPAKAEATVIKGGIKQTFERTLEKRADSAPAETDVEVSSKNPARSKGGQNSAPAKSTITDDDNASTTDDLDDLDDDVATTMVTPADTKKKDVESKDSTKQSTPKSTKLSASKTKVALSHEEYVAARIREERLPAGYTSFFDRSYKLRPEAIESVFIMWRLTGDNYWREKGWIMFQSIQRTTMTDSGNAAISDVTSVLGANHDSMESFWLAETLKYFYLLFSEPDLISLDDYVL